MIQTFVSFLYALILTQYFPYLYIFTIHFFPMRNVQSAFILLAVLCGILAVFSIVFEGTGDDGDSVMHYLFSRYAPVNPVNFLDHWAKPLFVLLSVIPAQLGFVGIKLFNVTCIGIAAWYTWLIARKLNLSYPTLVFVLFLLTPMTYSVGLSGLTEPLFACWLIVGIYMLMYDRFVWGSIWLSFLPFVRSEGLIILVCMVVYLIARRKWIYLPLLLLGHILYGIPGYFVYGDFLWTFTKIPYGTLNGVYGSGHLFHYFTTMNQVLSLPLRVLLITGMLYGLVMLIQWGKERFSIKHEHFRELMLIYGFFVSFFIAHTLFWYLGIFNSFGLTRVFYGVIPLIILIMLRGIMVMAMGMDALTTNKWILRTSSIGMLIVAVFFTVRDVKFMNLLWLNDAQKAMKSLYEEHAESLEDHTIIADSPYAAFVTGVNYYDPSQFRRIKSIYSGDPLPAKGVVFWEDMFAVFDSHADMAKLKQDDRFDFLGETSSISVYPWAERRAALFQLKPREMENTTLLFLDFEGMDQDINTDSTYAYSGRYSQAIHAEDPYSNGVNVFVSSLHEYEGYFVVGEAWLYCPEDACKGQMIFSFERKEKSYDYKSFELKPLFKKDEWVKVRFKRKIKPYQLPDDKLKVYFWNPEHQKVYIDDFHVWLAECE